MNVLTDARRNVGIVWDCTVALAGAQSGVFCYIHSCQSLLQHSMTMADSCAESKCSIKKPKFFPACGEIGSINVPSKRELLSIA